MWRLVDIKNEEEQVNPKYSHEMPIHSVGIQANPFVFV